MKVLVSALAIVILMIGAPSVQAFEGTSKDGDDAGYFGSKIRKAI